MKSNEIEDILLFIPLFAGMIGSFYFARRGATRLKSMPKCIGEGYLTANAICIIVFVPSAFIASMVMVSGKYLFFGSVPLGIILVSLASLFLGILLYIPSAFFGYSFGARKRAEAEIARTQQQILKDIQSENPTENQ